MNSKTWTRIIAMTLFTALAIPVQLAAQERKQAPPHYIVTDLGTLGGTFSSANSINNKGWVDGFSNLLGDLNGHAFLWRNGVMTDLKTLGGPNSTAVYPLNERGQVPGYSDTSTPDPDKEDFCGFGTHLICLPFVWQKGVMNPLPTLDGGNNALATEINNRGRVAGYAENSTHDSTCAAPNTQVLQVEPVIWEEGEIQQLPTFPGDPDGGANGINDRGQAVGGSGTCYGGPTPSLHALLWQGGTATDLGNLGGGTSSGQDINNQGQVVGFASLSDNTTVHAFLWTEDDGMQDLDTLPGDVTSFGYGINEQAKVVGTSVDASDNFRAFLWQQGVITDLNTLTPAGSPLFLLDAFGINSRGQIVGDALQKSTGQVHAYLATPSHSEAASESATSAATGETSLRPKVVLPENVRKMLRQRLGQRYHIPGSTPAASDPAFNPRQVETRTGWSPMAESGGSNSRMASSSSTHPVATLSPTSLRFLCRNVINLGCQCTRGTTKLTNTGNASLSITSITATGHFSETNACGKSLGIEKSCNISVAFHPPGIGWSYVGKVSVSDNAPGSPQTASLTGGAECRP